MPIGRLIRKLGLFDFNNTGPLLPPGPTPNHVSIPLSMHIGAPGEPVVKVGDNVSEGDMIARPPAGKLGVPIHASIKGRVTQVNGSVVIEA